MTDTKNIRITISQNLLIDLTDRLTQAEQEATALNLTMDRQTARIAELEAEKSGPYFLHYQSALSKIARLEAENEKVEAMNLQAVRLVIKTSAERKMTIYLDEDPIDVGQFYRAKGFEKLPTTPTMSGAEIRACGWKKNTYQMFIDSGDGVPFKEVGDSKSIPLVNGMRFWCLPSATTGTATLEAQLEAVGAGGVTAMIPKPAPAVVPCDDCDGLGVVGEPQYEGGFQLPAPDPCGSCGGSGEVKVVAQPAPAVVEQVSITLDFKQVSELLEMFGGEPAEITIQHGDGHSGKGLYAYYTDLPEEGCEFLGTSDNDAVPDAQAAQPAPAVVGTVVPDGWKLVPVEPDMKMVEAGKDAELFRPSCRSALVVYRAMLAAATQPQQIAEPASEKMLRFCPGCGSVGDVPEKFRDCCPDGNGSRVIPASLANKCHNLFQLALTAAATPKEQS